MQSGPLARTLSVALGALDACVLVVWRVRARCTGFLLARGAPEGVVCADTPSPSKAPGPVRRARGRVAGCTLHDPRPDVLQTKLQTIVHRVAPATGIVAPCHDALAILIV